MEENKISKELDEIKTSIKTLETKLNNENTQYSKNENKINKANETILKIVNSIYKKSFKVLWLSISIVVISILTIFTSMIPYAGFIISLILFAVCGALGIASFVINIINAIKILTTDFKNEEINNIKILWGIFTIIILGWIASLVFSISAKNKLNNEGDGGE